jgi:acyl carrier protein
MSAEAPAPTHDALRTELVALIAEVTRREPVDPATVTDETVCFGGALLQDSLDVLELVVAIDRIYGASLRDGDVGRKVLENMGTLTRFVSTNRTR